jgi:CheY-like chemotaxis protein
VTTILIIEDDRDAARILELTLKREGCTTFTASNGFEGLKLAQTQHPDLVLLDLMLPGIDGFEVCNRLRADPATASLPIIVVSAKPQLADRQMAAKAGANGYFTKPYRSSDLVAAIRVLANKKPPAAAAQATGVAFVGARSGEAATNVAVYTALALAKSGAPVNLVDLHPYAVDHCLLLNLAPRPAPVNLAQRETYAALPNSMVLHPDGLRLLNNLQGSGDAGQIAPADANATLEALLASGGYTLVDVPQYPIELLREASTRCALVVLVTAFDPVALGAARAALGMMDRIGLSSQQTGLILIGADDAPQPDLGRVVLATLPAAADPTHPAFQALAGRLRGLQSKS